MKQIVYIFFASLLLFACTKEAEQTQSQEDIPPQPDTTPQTTLMYMTGTDLSYYFGLNITAVKSAVSKNALGYGRFLVFKHSTSSSADLIEYRYENGDCVADTLKTYSSIKSLSLEAITEVVADTKELAQADAYNLIVSGHATGWVPKSRTTSSWSVASPTVPIDWEGMFSASGITTRYLGSTNDGYYDVDELKESLEATGTHFGYILFDECFMSSIEAIYSLRSLCDYIIASPCEIMGAGFPYDTALPELYSNYGLETNLQGACQAFYDYYAAYAYPSGCVALTVTAELDALVEIINTINLSGALQEVDLSAIQAYERLENHIFFDLEQYILASCSDSSLCQEFTDQMALAFPTDCRLHTERFFANIGVSASSSNNYEAYYTTISYYSGITTSQPSVQMSSEWEQTEWAGDIMQDWDSSEEDVTLDESIEDWEDDSLS